MAILQTELTVRDITGDVVTAGVAEQSIPLSLDGAAPAAEISVPLGTTLSLTEWLVSADAAGIPAFFKLQRSVDGVTFFNIALLLQGGTGGITLQGVQSIIVGSATAKLRVLAETVGGAARVLTTIRSQQQGASIILETELTPRDIAGDVVTLGAVEQNLNLSLDGAAPAAEISVPLGTTLSLTEWLVSSVVAGVPAFFKLQRSVDGVTFFDIASVRLAVAGGVTVPGIQGKIVGSATAKLRVRVKTAVAARVLTTIRSQQQTGS